MVNECTRTCCQTRSEAQMVMTRSAASATVGIAPASPPGCPMASESCPSHTTTDALPRPSPCVASSPRPWTRRLLSSTPIRRRRNAGLLACCSGPPQNRHRSRTVNTQRQHGGFPATTPLPRRPAMVAPAHAAPPTHKTGARAGGCQSTGPTSTPHDR